MPTLQSLGEPERAGEARRADSASNNNNNTPSMIFYKKETVKDELVARPVLEQVRSGR